MTCQKQVQERMILGEYEGSSWEYATAEEVLGSSSSPTLTFTGMPSCSLVRMAPCNACRAYRTQLPIHLEESSANLPYSISNCMQLKQSHRI